jgi:hypothetical protein
MDISSLILIAVAVLSLLGASAASFGTDTRDCRAEDARDRARLAHNLAPRIR